VNLRRYNLKRLVLRTLLAVVLLFPPAAFLHYFLPKTDVVRIVGTEVRRFDETTAGGQTRTRDIFYIFAQDLDGRTRVYKNEDTGWGFPWYFKFDTADLQARAASMADNKGTALVRYYGWRIRVLSWFPNAVSMRQVEPDHFHIPWFNLLFLTVLGGSIAFIWRKVSQFLRRRRKPAPYSSGLEGTDA
jgi:hypothetical protein